MKLWAGRLPAADPGGTGSVEDPTLQLPRAAPESVARVTGRLNRAIPQLGQVGVRALRHSRVVEPDADARIREFAEALAHELSSPLAAAESAALMLDAARWELVLLNLIGNAAKYADRSRGLAWVRLGIRRENNPGSGWCLEVSDNGLGIPREHQERVFEHFLRAHPDHAGGTGLGLSVVRESVRQLGGRIELQSEPGVGTTFRIFLPSSLEHES